jgi:hypothetical protein
LTLFKNSIAITRANTTKSNTGELESAGFSAIATVQGDIQAKSGRLRSLEYGKEVEANYIMYCTIAAVKEGDKVSLNGTDYKAMFVNNIQGHHLEVDLALWR